MAVKTECVCVIFIQIKNASKQPILTFLLTFWSLSETFIIRISCH